ncbi:MAG: glycoside hydrolase family 15 protein [Actinomycetota bacterium]|nr:glycoside hydrolase family 15 protein [Actinomycetota bacterium]
MAERLEDYGLIGDLQSAALVGRSGSIDWLCLPRFDSGACFAALLGSDNSGRWLIEPAGEVRERRQRYRGETLVLETEVDTAEGTIRLIDFMPPRGRDPDVVRIVEGVRGRVECRLELVIRFDYGSIVPWVRRIDGDARLAIAGPDGLCFRTPVEIRGENLRTVGDFTVSAGDRIPFVLTWFASHRPPPDEIDAEQALRDTERFWTEWSRRCTYDGEWRDEVVRSLIVLKALTYDPTGGIVAAPTTSLPEHLGGVRNWDYRYCWLRDATFTLDALLLAGYTEEAGAWRDWLLRAVAGDPADLQIMYGPAGERRLTELELDWLPGYEGSRPVRVGNAASGQFQLDVYGEVMDALYVARREGLVASDAAWALLRNLMQFLEVEWDSPDEGIWEVRGPRRHFTHSKVMAWVAVDRAVRLCQEFGREGPVDRWRALRDRIHAEVCERGYDVERGAFVQSYGSKLLDASLLMIPLVGFLPAGDERVRSTVDVIQRELVEDGFVRRYEESEDAADVDGLPPGEGAFLPCSFWLVDNLALLGRVDEARELYERLLAVGGPLGLLAEEHEPRLGRLVGNFPQAFSHVGLVNSAFNLSHAIEGPAERRCLPAARM